MANTVFNTDSSKPLVVRAGKAIVKVGDTTLIALGVEMSFQRSVEMIPTLSSRRVASIGEGTGQFSAQSVLSKENGLESGMHLFDDGCVPFAMTITFNDSACSMNGKTVTAHNCIASSVSISAAGGRGYVAEGVSCTFTALSLG